MDNPDSQGALFGVEDEMAAARQCIYAIGGEKHAASLLWPAVALDDATAKLRRCLNPQKRDVLHVREWLVLAREARRRGCLIGVAFVTDFCECAAPVPVSPEDEEDELRRDFIRAHEGMASIVRRLEVLEKRRGTRGGGSGYADLSVLDGCGGDGL